MIVLENISVLRSIHDTKRDSSFSVDDTKQHTFEYSTDGSREIPVRDLFCLFSYVSSQLQPATLIQSLIYTFLHCFNNIFFSTPPVLAYQFCPSGLY